MFRKLFFGCMFFGLAGNISAQKPEDHKKTTYTDSIGRFIIQVDMPLYLYVSTSPDEKPRRLERSDEKGKENEPIYLDGPGKHYIRHQDNVNHRAEIFDIYADGRAPKTSISFSGAPTIVNDGVTYFGQNLTATLSATDDLAGVKQIYYSTDHVNFAPYRNIDASKEGNYRLSYYTVDYVGNVETVKQKEFVVDLSPPATYHNVTGISKDEIISTSTKIYLTSSDSLSGLERIMYRFNDEPEKPYKLGTMIPFVYLPDGSHILYYYAVDRVGNKEPEKTFAFSLDKSAPIMSADVLGDRFIVGDKVYFSGRTKLKLTAVDNRSGVKEIRYSINDDPFVEYQDPFYLPSKSGKHIIRYYAVDEMENMSSGDYTHNTGIVYVDLTGPQLSHQLSGASFQKGDVTFVGPECKVILKAIDTESGVQYISYSIDNQADETQFEDPFSVKGSGTHTIKYFGYDNVNNRNSREFEITVDDDGPEIFATFSVKRIDSETSENTDDAGVYPSYVMLYLAATDLMTGNAEIYYSIDGEKEVPYTAPIRRFVKNSSYTIVVRAKDKLDNFSEKTIRFKTGDY